MLNKTREELAAAQGLLAAGWAGGRLSGDDEFQLCVTLPSRTHRQSGHDQHGEISAPLTRKTR